MQNGISAGQKNEHFKDHKRKHRPDFIQLDLNQDGVVDFEEFIEHKLPRGDHQTVFAKIDTDTNGILNQQEYDSHKPSRKHKHKRQSN